MTRPARRLLVRFAVSLGLIGAVATGVLTNPASAGPTRAAGAGAPTTPIQHVVFIYRENHSFDNMFAIYCEQKRTCDGRTDPVKLTDGQFHDFLPADDVSPEICHAAICQRFAIDGGQMDGWDRFYGCRASDHYGCLQQYTPAQIPGAVWMADHGVLSDRFFSMPNPSAGAHMFLITGEDTLGFTGDNPNYTPSGYVRKYGWGCDSRRQGNWFNSASGDFAKEWFCNPNASWLPNGGAAGPTEVTAAPDFLTSILDPYGVTWTNYGQAAPEKAWAWNLPPYHAAALANDRNKIVDEKQVIADAQDGTLPQVSFVTPSAGNEALDNTSQHNEYSTAVGDNFLIDVLTAIANGPDASNTAVIWTYDDCGCFYDHVPPPSADLGPRVPLVLWSYWARAGMIDHRPARFSSILAFIEKVFGLPSLTSLNPSAEDGRVRNDLMADFDFSKPPPTRPMTARSLRLPPKRPISAADRAWLRNHLGRIDED